MDTLDKSKQSSSVISATVQFEGNDKILVGMICGLLGFWLFAQSMLNVNLVMGKSLHLDSSTLNFAVSIMAMVCGMFIVVIGRLGDILGHTRVLRIGYYLSIVGSIIIAVVPLSGIAGPLLILGRILMGVSGAAIMPTSLALIKRYWQGHRQQRAISLWSMGTWGGGAFASFVGGLISKYLNSGLFEGWRWIFIFCALTATLGVFLLRDLPQDPKPASNTPSKFDYLGSFILVLMLVSLMIIITNGGAWGWLSLTTNLLAVIFLVCISLFYRIENKRGKEALIDLQLFKSKKFSGATIVNFCMNSMAGLLIIAMMLIQQGAQVDESSAGMLTLGYGIALVSFIRVGEVIMRKCGKRFPILLGLSLVMIATLLLLPTHIMAHQYKVLVIISMTFFGLGLALFATPITDVALSDLDNSDAGVGSGIFKMASSLGAAIGVAISTGLFMGISMSSNKINFLDAFLVWMGRQENVMIRAGAMIAIFFNLLIIVVAIFITMRTIPGNKESRK